MSRVLIVASDVVGPRMAGPGIRAWEFAHQLAKDHDLTLASPTPGALPASSFVQVAATRGSVAAAARGADVVIVQGNSLDLVPAGGGHALVVDLYDPSLVEDLEIHGDRPRALREDAHRGAVALARRQLGRGDFFLCASQRQRLFWLGALAATGRITPSAYDGDHSLEKLVAVVPFGLPDHAPTARGPALRGVVDGIGPEDRIVLWGGGIWNWFDPLTLIEATARLAGRHPELRVVFMGARHPNPSVPRMRMASEAVALAERRGLESRSVFFVDRWVPYQERQDLLLEADFGVSLHRSGIETTLAFRTRVLDYLWAGLPMLLSEGDEFAEMAEKEGFGLVCPPGDVEAAAAALAQLLEDPGLAERCRHASRATSTRFRWSTVAAPLLDFCRQPRRSPEGLGRALDAGLSGGGARSVVRKAWNSVRQDGPVAFIRRTRAYLHRRVG